MRTALRMLALRRGMTVNELIEKLLTNWVEKQEASGG